MKEFICVKEKGGLSYTLHRIQIYEPRDVRVVEVAVVVVVVVVKRVS